MTRKLKHSCDASPAHYQLAALAITQVGMMRKFRSSDGFSHKVVLDQDPLAGVPGEYNARPGAGHTVQVHTETGEGCLQEFTFTWPDLRLLSMEVVICEHTGFERDVAAEDT